MGGVVSGYQQGARDDVPVSGQRMRQRALLSLSTFSEAAVYGRGNTLQKRSVSSPAAPTTKYQRTAQKGRESHKDGVVVLAHTLSHLQPLQAATSTPGNRVPQVMWPLHHCS